MAESMPRAAEGVGKAYVSRSTFAYGWVKHANSPQTSTIISFNDRHLHDFIDGGCVMHFTIINQPKIIIFIAGTDCQYCLKAVIPYVKSSFAEIAGATHNTRC